MQKFFYRFSGERVKAWMSRRNLEIGDLAKITGLTTTQVAALLGGANPTVATVERLSDSMQVHPGKFFSREVVRNG
jgi:transcriptional regulator with XRE-family HTH domain